MRLITQFYGLQNHLWLTPSLQATSFAAYETTIHSTSKISPVQHVKPFIPYTRVNKRIHLFTTLQGTMRLIMKGKNWPHLQNHDTSLVACVHDSKWVVYFAGEKNLKAGQMLWLAIGSVFIWECGPWTSHLQGCLDAKNRRRVACGHRRYCIVEIH